MAFATLDLYVCTGTNASTETLVSDNIASFLNADIHSIDVGSYPIAIPESVSESPNYSMEKVLRWKLASLPDNYIQNIKVYGSTKQIDDPNNKITINLGTTTSGATPTDAGSSIADTSQHDNYYDGVSNNLSIGVVPVDDKLDAIGEYTDYLYAQMKVEVNASQSQVGTLTLTIAYEEV